MTHYDAGKSNVRTYLFRDYTEALTKAHGVRQAYPDFSLEMIQSIARENIDPEFYSLPECFCIVEARLSGRTEDPYVRSIEDQY